MLDGKISWREYMHSVLKQTDSWCIFKQRTIIWRNELPENLKHRNIPITDVALLLFGIWKNISLGADRWSVSSWICKISSTAIQFSKLRIMLWNYSTINLFLCLLFHKNTRIERQWLQSKRDSLFVKKDAICLVKTGNWLVPGLNSEALSAEKDNTRSGVGIKSCHDVRTPVHDDHYGIYQPDEGYRPAMKPENRQFNLPAGNCRCCEFRFDTKLEYSVARYKNERW